MLTFVVFACGVAALGIFLSWSFQLIGALGASLLVGLFSAFVMDALRGFGSPTAQVSEFHLPSFLENFAIAFFIACLIFPGITFLKQFLNGGVERTPFIIWAAVVGLSIAGYTGREIYVKSHSYQYEVTVGYDEELRLQWNDFEVILKDGKSEQQIFIHSGGGSLEPGPWWIQA